MKTIDELGISPAPWKDNVWQSSDDRGHDIKDGHNHLIAEMFLMSGKERMANARLISAAPELYKLMLEAITWLADISAEVVGNKCARQIDDLLSRMKAALAKASGEEVE